MQYQPLASILRKAGGATSVALLLTATSLPVSAAPKTGADAPSADQLAFFEKKIRPVLAQKCYQCHSVESGKSKGGLLLDTRDGIRNGGDSGHAVVPGSLGDSLLLKAVRGEKKMEPMPPKEKLSPEVIADFEKWIAMGAPDPRDGKTVVKRTISIEEGKKFWAFQPPQATPAPKVKNSAWARTDIDRHILAGLEAKGLKPAADADKATLLRRVYFDLIGLPPAPEEVAAFLNDKSAQALEKVVDKLLASPQFGERWGRHWLDVARYAESTGKERNYTFPEAWRYRDYVIQSVNADKPYDQFIREQIAGDLLPAKDAAHKNEQIIATGFLAIGTKSLNERNPEIFRMDVIDDQIDVTTRAILGTTVSCARCHDHKFDPIPTADYYAMAGIFRSTETLYGTNDGEGAAKNRRPSTLVPLLDPNGPLPVSEVKVASAESAGGRGRMSDVNASVLAEARKLAQAGKRAEAMAMIKAAGIGQGDLTAAKAGKAKAAKAGKYGQQEQPKQVASAAGLAMGVQEGRAADCPIYIRGETEEKGPVIPRGFVQVMATKSDPKINPAHSGRLELADWLVAKENPLTARVMVNRTWQHLFGEGIVRTADNFGATGTAPSHPALLDQLALQFMADGWSVKKLVRSLVLSHTYQLSSAYDAKSFKADPDNVLLWRASERRLDAEAIRDAMLAVSGNLDLVPAEKSPVAKVGTGYIGRGIRPDEFATDSRKRSVYVPIVRDFVPDILGLFDFAEPSLIVAARDVTNVPAQALFMMNSPFVHTQAQSAARRLLAIKDLDDRKRITQAYLLALSRAPSDAEMKRAEDFLLASKGEKAAAIASEKEWTTLCQALFACAEFRYLK
jgi:hypothetical protein